MHARLIFVARYVMKRNTKPNYKVFIDKRFAVDKIAHMFVS